MVNPSLGLRSLIGLILITALFRTKASAQLFGLDIDLEHLQYSLTKTEDVPLNRPKPSSSQARTGDATLNGYRLPNNTYPLRYDLSLKTNIHLETDDPIKFRFDGKVRIALQALEVDSTIYLHARLLTITDASLWTQDTEAGVPLKMWTTDQVAYDTMTEFLSFTLDEGQQLEQSGLYTLEINYYGTLRELEGFYRSSYTDETGKLKWLATTHFEATNAQHAFPCYDEPSIRAPIKVTIEHGKDYFAVSNMPVESTTVNGDYTTTVFQDTPPMQTYLLAFVVSDFGYIEIHGSTPQRVFAQKQQIARGEGDFGVRAGVKILTQLENYFGIPYSNYNPKMDQIAIPDFSAGAMENWGLVTYRRAYLLFDETTDSTANKHNVASTVAHEYTHQYFGNLVSPKWWSYLWLNEGFATLYGNLALTPIYPEFNDDELFVLSNFQTAMNMDGLGTTRPMTHYVESPAAVQQLFDIVAYQKAGSVLRMLQNAVTEPVWRAGLTEYLTVMQNQAADSDNLAAAIQLAADAAKINLKGLTMKQIIDSWSLKAGLPVVQVSLDTAKNELTFTQSRFLFTPTQAPLYPNSNDIWLVPVTLATATEPIQKGPAELYLKDKTTPLPLGSSSTKWRAGDWILVNADASGYYRVQYDKELLDRLIKKLHSDSFDDINLLSRTQLIDDALAFGTANTLDYATILKLLGYLSREKNFLPWTTGSRGLLQFNWLLAESPNFALFTRFVNELVAPLYKSYGIRDLGSAEPYSDKRSREIAIAWACRTGEESCIMEARARVNASLLNTAARVEPNLQSVMYCAGLRQVSDVEFNLVLKKVLTFTSAAERQRLLTALGCTQNSQQQKAYLQTTIDESAQALKYAAGERELILRSVSSNEREGVANSIEFLTKNYNTVERLYGAGAVKRGITFVASLVTSKSTLEKYVALMGVAKTNGDLNDEEIASYKAITDINIRWIEANEVEVAKYLKELYRTGGATAFLVSSVVLALCVTLSVFFA